VVSGKTRHDHAAEYAPRVGEKTAGKPSVPGNPLERGRKCQGGGTLNLSVLGRCRVRFIEEDDNSVPVFDLGSFERFQATGKVNLGNPF
jgi:hypothetical protein